MILYLRAILLMKKKFFLRSFSNNANANHIKLKKEQSFRKKNNREWYVSKALNDRITYLHIKRAINIIIPREYVSRERSRRHIGSNYLPGLELINSDHNVQKYCFYVFKLSSGYHLGKIFFWKTKEIQWSQAIQPMLT